MSEEIKNNVVEETVEEFVDEEVVEVKTSKIKGLFSKVGDAAKRVPVKKIATGVASVAGALAVGYLFGKSSNNASYDYDVDDNDIAESIECDHSDNVTEE